VKAAAFAYHRPGTVAEAVQMLGEWGEDAKILAGGQSLVPMLAMRLTHFENLIDISRVDELKNIESRGDELVVAAGTPHSLVGMDDEVADSVPLLTLSTPYIGHFQIRTRGTLGGAIAHADPAAEQAAVALALDATIEATSSRGRRDIAAADFFTGLWETSLASDEILTAVRFPVWGGRSGFAVEEFARRHGDFAIAGATIAVQLDDDDRVTRCGIGLLGLGSTPLRGSEAESAVIGRRADEVTGEDVGRLAIAELSEIPADLQGSADYRARVGAAMVARAWAAAVRQAQTFQEAIHA
jgi:aerobic carbon-monoxide dehydrogenase medium subunit